MNRSASFFIVATLALGSLPILSIAEDTATFSAPRANSATQATEPSTDKSGWALNVNLLGGPKYLNKDSWNPVERQNEAGLDFDLRGARWPCSLAVGFRSAKRDVNGTVPGVASLGSLPVESLTREFSVGARTIWNDLTFAHPFVGAGLANIYARKTVDVPSSSPVNLSGSDSDSKLGYYAELGFFVTANEHVNVGVDARYSHAKLRLNDQNVDGGGLSLLLLVGYHFSSIQ
jgi:hypothetical protein